MSPVLVLTMLLGTQLGVAAQTTDTNASQENVAPSKPHQQTPEEIELREMRQALQAQQQQINELKQQLQMRGGGAASAQQAAAAAGTAQQAATTATLAAQQAAAATAASAQQAAAAANTAQQAQQAAEQSNAKGDAALGGVARLQSAQANLNQTVVLTDQQLREEFEAPTAVHYKGVDITPGGFAAFEGVWRQHSTNSGINTPFNGVPFPSANQGHVSELNFSGRQSRLSMLVTGDAGSYRLAGYYEMDWLGTGTSSNNNQSNSYVLRQRQIWGQGALPNGFTVTGGQMWSLVTEDRKGTDARTEIQPETIDPQYLVGYSWTRQPEIRVQQRWGDYETGAFTIAAAAAQAQITNFTAAGDIPTQFFFGGPGNSGGLYNAAQSIGAGNTPGSSAITTYANNLAPDFIVKAAYDQPWIHVEFGGIARFMRNEFFPATPGTAVNTYTYGATLTSNTAPAGGVFGAIRVYPTRNWEIGIQGMGGPGVGRYGSSQLADATLKPNEELEPIRNYHGMFSLVGHPTRKLEVFTYYGGEYDQRTVYPVTFGSTTELIGYGPQTLNDTGCYNLPSSIPTVGAGGSSGAPNCASPTRYIQEAMGGFIYRVFDSASKGRLQYWVTYSYIQRNLWSGIGSATTPTGPRATEPMIHVSMRYYIP
ncbi:MAG: hypothetical protein ACLGQU_04710 [Acidobacteriota bacterium]